jgi:hypothetical protein
MILFGHHIAVELFGREFSPETPMEHALVFGATGLFLGLVVYGTYAAVRDLRRWFRQNKGHQALPKV